jgi:ABC-type phosphate transport system substrate-binding protein
MVLSVAVVLMFSSAVSARVRLSETGSTLLYPILTVGIGRFAPTSPNVRIDAAASGRGVGVASVISGRAQIGGSDAYLTDAQMKTNALESIPLAVSAQEIDYNVPELRDQPTTEATRATAQAMANAVPDDGRLSMIYTAGPDAYPLINFVYAIVKSNQRAPGSASALRDFLNWIVSADEGNDAALLASVHFAPLPERVRAIARRQISAIAGP